VLLTRLLDVRGLYRAFRLVPRPRFGVRRREGGWQGEIVFCCFRVGREAWGRVKGKARTYAAGAAVRSVAF
jgi:hypothetical protein